MYPVSISTDRAAQLLSAVASGTDLPVPTGGWSALDMIAAAGVLYFAASSHGPAHIPAERLAKLPQEYREATSDTLMQDLLDAIEFAGYFAMQVQDNTLDERVGSQLQAVLFRDADGNKHAQVVKG
jgi:hypothetical protein